MDYKQQWRFLYIMILSWNYHPKAGVIKSEEWIAEMADRELLAMQRQETRRWPDGQQSRK